MRNKSVRIISIGVVVILTILIIKDTFTQSGVNELKGGFNEVAKYRNENNTGPVQHIFAVSVADTAAAQLLEYGNLMPHHKYGTTKVYYFLKGTAIPKQLFPGEINFDAKYNSSCFALFLKGPMGDVDLIKQPFR